MATHSSTLAWKILWTEEPGGLQFMGFQRVGYHWVTKHSLYPWMILCISVVWVATSFFHFWFFWVGTPLLLLMSLVKSVSIFSYHFKEPALSFIDPFSCYLVLISFVCPVIFIITFLVLTLDFVCSFFSSFRYKGWVIWNFCFIN